MSRTTSAMTAIGGNSRGGGFNQFSPFDEAYPIHIRTRLRSTENNGPLGQHNLSGFGVDSLNFRDYGRNHNDEQSLYAHHVSDLGGFKQHPKLTNTANAMGNVPPGSFYSEDWFTGVEAIAQNRRTDDMISSLGSIILPISHQSNHENSNENHWNYNNDIDALAILNTINSRARDDNYEDLLTANYSVGDGYFAPHIQHKTENTRWSHTPEFWTKLGGLYKEPNRNLEDILPSHIKYAPHE